MQNARNFTETLIVAKFCRARKSPPGYFCLQYVLTVLVLIVHTCTPDRIERLQDEKMVIGFEQNVLEC